MTPSVAYAVSSPSQSVLSDSHFRVQISLKVTTTMSMCTELAKALLYTPTLIGQNRKINVALV